MVATLERHHQLLLETVKRRHLVCFGHVTPHDTLSKTVLQGTLEGGQHRSDQRKSWITIVKEWIDRPVQDLLIIAQATVSIRAELYPRSPTTIPRTSK